MWWGMQELMRAHRELGCGGLVGLAFLTQTTPNHPGKMWATFKFKKLQTAFGSKDNLLNLK